IIAQAQEVSDTIGTQYIKEVVVKAERPYVKSENGAMVVDLPGIVKDKPVNNILESLFYLPGVTNQEGGISLVGANSTTIIINGEASQMSTEQLYQLLYSMPISRLKQVELIQAAPAKYHVNGGVINVILKTPTALDGLQGQARIGYGQSHYASCDGAMSLLYATHRWTFEANYSLTKNKTWNSTAMTSWHTLSDGQHLVYERDKQTAGNLANTVYCAIGYKINETNSLKATYSGQYTGRILSDTHSTGTFGQFLNSSVFGKPKMLNNVNLNYESGFGLSLSADYLSYNEMREQRMEKISTIELLVNSINKQRINKYHFTADMQHDVKGWGLNYGVDYKFSDDHSSMEYLTPENPGFKNNLSERSVKGYVGLEHSFSCGLSFQTSLAEELYRLDGKNNWTFLPQLAMTYYKTPTHVLQASFNANRIFPSYWTLHGGVGYLNPYSEVWGNPSLKPSTEYALQASYIFKRKYVATLFFMDIDNYAVQLPYQSQDELKLIFQEQNFNYDRKIGINLDAPITVSSWFDTRFSLQVYYEKIRADSFHDISFKRDKLCLYGAIQNTIKLKKGLSFTLDAKALSGALQGIADLSSIWQIDAGMKWSFAKNNCCEFNLRADDIFNSWSPVMKINYKTQNYRMEVKDMTRNLKLTFVYRFNGFKPKDTSIDTSRLGTK
ncbi:MAG: TonB-dependent receptor, partial [Prevotella sp.]|nr:TonB-dependent receptor [Prevotella sp.]